MNGNKLISFDSIEIITRSNKKIININKIGSLKKELKIKIKNDIKNIIKKKNLINSSSQLHQFLWEF